MKPIHAGLLLAAAALATSFAASLGEGTGRAAGGTAVRAAAVSGSGENARLAPRRSDRKLLKDGRASALKEKSLPGDEEDRKAIDPGVKGP